VSSEMCYFSRATEWTLRKAGTFRIAWRSWSDKRLPSGEMTKQHTDSEFYREVLKRLRDYSVDQNLANLIRAGADRNVLLERLAVISRMPSELQRLNKRDARAHALQIRQTADLMESLNRRPDNGPLLDPIHAGREISLPKEEWKIVLTNRAILCLPEVMREYACRVESLPDYVQIGWKPIKTAAIAQLIWYVKGSTKKDHYHDVAPLIGAFLRDGQWSPRALKQWCYEHRTEIDKLGDLFVLPYFPRPPRSR
jgi:hypothetical protein